MRLKRAAVTPTILQLEVTECALAVLAMLLGQRGRATSLESLRQAAGVSRDGLPLPRLRALAAGHGFRLHIFRRELEALRRVPLPAMVYVNFNHMLVIEAVDDDGFQVNDPASGPRAMDWAEMDRGFSGLVMWLGEALPADGAAPDAPPPPRAARPLASLSFAGAGIAALTAGAALAASAANMPAAGMLLVSLALPAGAAALALLLRAARRLQRGGDLDTWRRFLRQHPSYFANRSPAVLAGLLGARGSLARLVAGSGASLLMLLAGLPSLVLLGLRSPASAAAVSACIALIIGVQCGVHLHRRSHWRRSLALDNVPGLGLQELSALETLQLARHDDDFLLRLCGAAARGSRLAQALAMARARSHVLTLALIAAGAAASAGLAAPDARPLCLLLAILVLVPWRRPDELVHAILTLPKLRAALDDPAVAALPWSGPASLAERGLLHLRALGFGYGKMQPPLLQDLDLSLHAGERLGIGGAPGCGKTTLGKLMAGVLMPTRGSVAVGGSILRVATEPLLFAGTVADNLRLWQGGFGDAMLDDALALAGLREEVAARGGLDARVEDGGVNWSGGQRRRMMLARALLRRPAVLVIDEALDGVDLAMESAILDGLRTHGITVVLISRRRESLAACDRQLWLGDEAAPAASSQQDATPPDAAAPAAAIPNDPLQAACPPDAWAALKTAAQSLGLPTQPVPLDVGQAGAHLSLADAALHMGLLLRPVLLGGEALPSQGAWPLLACRPSGTVRRQTRWRCITPDERGRYPAVQDDEACYAVHPRRPATPSGNADAWSYGVAILLGWSAAAAAGHALAGIAAAPVFAGAPLMAFVAALFALLCAAWSGRALQARWQARLRFLAAAARPDRALRYGVQWLQQQDLAALAAALGRQGRRDVTQPLIRVEARALGLVLLAWAPVQALLLPAAWSIVLAAAVLLTALAHALLVVAAARAEEAAEGPALAAQRMLTRIMGGFADFRAQGSAIALFRHWRAAQALADALQWRAQRWQLVRNGLRFGLPLYLPLLVFDLPAGVHAASPLELQLGVGLSIAAAGAFGARLGELLLARRAAATDESKLAGPDEADGRPSARGRADPYTGVQAARALVLKDVHFSYAGRPVLQGVDLHLAPGEIIALTAPTGSGKTTLLRLLMGLARPQRGSVQYGGADLQQLDRQTLRRRWGAVQQDEALPAGLLRQLLGGLHRGATVRALQMAHAVRLDADIAAMPMGLATPAFAASLSAGQAQKLMLGRALGRGPQLLVLDEALSALDGASRAQVLGAVRAIGASCVVVTHDPDTLALCDRHVVLRDGKIFSRAVPSGAVRPAGRAQAMQAATASADTAMPAGDHPLYRARALALADSGAQIDQVPPLQQRPVMAMLAGLLAFAMALVMSA